MVHRFTTTDERVRQDYFDWLCGQVRHHEHWLLLKALHDRDFVAMIDKDENRALDGIALREEYFETNPYYDTGALEGPCSILEMLIALARRIDFSTQNTEIGVNRTAEWFWEMVENLGLKEYSDEDYFDLDGMFNVSEALDVFLSRSYAPDGNGGLFPLKYPTVDQREVELWFQKELYLKERGL